MTLHARGKWSDYGGVNDTPLGPMLSTFMLHTQECREAFLERLVAVGEPGLLEATARVYALLAEPKGYHCAKIAKAARVAATNIHFRWDRGMARSRNGHLVFRERPGAVGSTEIRGSVKWRRVAGLPASGACNHRKAGRQARDQGLFL